MYTYIQVYICVCICVHTHIHIHICIYNLKFLTAVLEENILFLQWRCGAQRPGPFSRKQELGPCEARPCVRGSAPPAEPLPYTGPGSFSGLGHRGSSWPRPGWSLPGTPVSSGWPAAAFLTGTPLFLSPRSWPLCPPLPTPALPALFSVSPAPVCPPWAPGYMCLE